MVFFVVSCFRDKRSFSFPVYPGWDLLLKFFTSNKPAYLLVQVEKPSHQIQVDRLVDVMPLHLQ
jgi:hypothetical protein